MTTPTDAGLLPCPFCGNQPEPSGYYAVICMGCGVSGPSGGNFEEALTSWNRRAPQAVVGGEPVYQASYKEGFWQDCSQERYEYLKNPEITSLVNWTLRILYTAPPPQDVREPLPKFLALKFHARRDKKATVTLLFDGHETADAWVRGITKGGQHGAE